jgi:hypothetical protein
MRAFDLIREVSEEKMHEMKSEGTMALSRPSRSCASLGVGQGICSQGHERYQL